MTFFPHFFHGSINFWTKEFLKTFKTQYYQVLNYKKERNSEILLKLLPNNKVFWIFRGKGKIFSKRHHAHNSGKPSLQKVQIEKNFLPNFISFGSFILVITSSTAINLYKNLLIAKTKITASHNGNRTV